MNLRRSIIFYLVLVLLAVSLAGAASLQKAQTVYACSWSVEHTNTVSKAYYSPWLGGTDYLYARITTYAGGAGVGCTGYKYYLSQQWTLYGSPGAYYTEVRVWVCSTYYGAWASGTPSVASPSYHYSIYCGRQADNYSSYFNDANGGGKISVYINQG